MLGLGLGLGLTARGGGGKPSWLPTGALAAVNYSGSSIQRYRASRSFSRSSTGTYLDASGVLQTAAIDALRINYDGSGNRLGALLEVARTNLVKFSSDLSAWTNVVTGAASVTVTGNNATAPNGLTEAAKIQFSATAAGEFAIRRQTISGLTNPSTVAPSIWLRADSSLSLWVRQGNLSFAQITVGTTWQRFLIASGSDATTSFNFDISANSTGGEASAAKTVYGWGGQLELASAASSYIATGASTSTRSADAETISPSDQASSFDWHVKYDDDSTGIIATAVTGAFDVDPSTLTRPNVKMIWAEAAA